MNTLSEHRPAGRAWARGLAALGLATGAWVLSAGWSPAHAGDVYWSVGVNGPGVVVGASNAPVVVHRPPPAYYYQPAPVVVVPPPGYGHHRRPPPQVVYVQPPYGYAPPVVVAPRPIVIGGRGDRWRQDDRWDNDRWDDRHRGHNRRDWDDDRRGRGRD